MLAIKQTLYRVGSNSPIVKALMHAREQDKQVTVLVELKARFDEENNITWARALERAGVHVVYGLLGLKTHSKIALVVRREGDGMRRYVHLGTGNYNATTARVYTDLGLLTCRPEIGADASDLFNFLTGYSRQRLYRKLLVAPVSLREGLENLIKREMEHAEQGRGGRIILKLNAVVDPSMIDLLYQASRAGVKIDLIARGICCLRPGVPGLSENISVRSVVGRFLEHSRIFYFGNGGADEVYLGSADLMQRNLDRRVETLFPIEDASLIAHIRDDLLMVYLHDTARARILSPDGSYLRAQPEDGATPIDSQAFFAAGHDIAARLENDRAGWGSGAGRGPPPSPTPLNDGNGNVSPICRRRGVARGQGRADHGAGAAAAWRFGQVGCARGDAYHASLPGRDRCGAAAAARRGAVHGAGGAYVVRAAAWGRWRVPRPPQAKRALGRGRRGDGGARAYPGRRAAWRSNRWACRARHGRSART